MQHSLDSIDNRPPPATDATAPATDPPVSITAVRRIFGTDDDGDLRPLLARFPQSALQHVSAIGNAANSGDLAAVATTAHCFKSAARYAGALALGELLAVLEVRANAGDAGAVSALHAEILAELQNVLHFIEQFLRALDTTAAAADG